MVGNISFVLVNSFILFLNGGLLNNANVAIKNIEIKMSFLFKLLMFLKAINTTAIINNETATLAAKAITEIIKTAIPIVLITFIKILFFGFSNILFTKIKLEKTKNNPKYGK